MAAQRPTGTSDKQGKGTDVVPLRTRTAQRYTAAPAEDPVVFDDAVGPGWLAAQWSPDNAVELTIGSLHGSDVMFRLAAADVLELVRVLVEGLNEPGPPRLGPPAPVLKLPPRDHPVS
jgi:hypothetical protein